MDLLCHWCPRGLAPAGSEHLTPRDGDAGLGLALGRDDLLGNLNHSGCSFEPLLRPSILQVTNARRAVALSHSCAPFLATHRRGDGCYTAVHTVLTVNSVSLAMMSVGCRFRSYIGFSNVARTLVFSWPA